MENKKPWFSKTLWLNAIMAAAALAGLGGVNEYLQGHGEVVIGAWSLLNILLRLISKDKISLAD